MCKTQCKNTVTWRPEITCLPSYQSQRKEPYDRDLDEILDKESKIIVISMFKETEEDTDELLKKFQRNINSWMEKGDDAVYANWI